jgi:hypothetical protein
MKHLCHWNQFDCCIVMHGDSASPSTHEKAINRYSLRRKCQVSIFPRKSEYLSGQTSLLEQIWFLGFDCDQLSSFIIYRKATQTVLKVCFEQTAVVCQSVQSIKSAPRGCWRQLGSVEASNIPGEEVTVAGIVKNEACFNKAQAPVCRQERNDDIKKILGLV